MGGGAGARTRAGGLLSQGRTRPEALAGSQAPRGGGASRRPARKAIRSPAGCCGRGPVGLKSRAASRVISITTVEPSRKRPISAPLLQGDSLIAVVVPLAQLAGARRVDQAVATPWPCCHDGGATTSTSNEGALGGVKEADHALVAGEGPGTPRAVVGFTENSSPGTWIMRRSVPVMGMWMRW